MKMRFHIWIACGIGGLLLLAALFVLFMNGVAVPFAGRSVMDLRQYPALRTQWEPTGLVVHFPATIPPSATKARMFVAMSDFRGIATFQIRMTLPAGEIESVEAKWSPLASHRFVGGDTNDHQSASGGVPTTFDYTNGTESKRFEPSFIILVLEAQPQGAKDHPWDQGTSRGLAISKSKQEVVYWCERW